MRVAIGVALAVGAPDSTTGQQTAAQDLYAELTRGVGAKTELSGGNSFEETLIVELYFYASTADSSSLEIEVIRPGGKSKRERVFAVSAGLGTAGAFVERCQVNGRGLICRSLARPARFQDMAGSDWGEFVEIEIPFQDMDWGGEFLRLTLPEGAYTLQGYADEDDDDNLVVKRDSDGNAIRRPSPDLMAPLPAPSDLDRQYLEQRPFLRFDVSPLTRDEGSDDGGFDNLSLSFDGGIYRPLAQGNALWQTKWSGSVATKAGLAFNRLTLETGAAFNLLHDDWLPITVSAKGESDQAFDAIDLSAEARLAYVLPFNLALQSGAYRPAVAPLINIIAAYGVGLSRPDSVANAAGVFSPPSTPDDAFSGWDTTSDGASPWGNTGC